ncbi:hypothetical protein IV203_008077 [Nitzschia inconspicua]|uniref:Uncharacterized protein n=1 Tax=Nitzschia inconspicua TaxID=303405 RepID=A0A9K3KYZ9_9STRA|nr:hypothetical protein IV203_008077 [Nitzschia inconspicua]
MERPSLRAANKVTPCACPIVRRSLSSQILSTISRALNTAMVKAIEIGMTERAALSLFHNDGGMGSSAEPSTTETFSTVVSITFPPLVTTKSSGSKASPDMDFKKRLSRYHECFLAIG